MSGVVLHRPDDWRAWRASGPPGSVGGSDVARIMGDYPFRSRPDQDHADQGHALEPLILDRLHAYLRAVGEDVPPFEQGWVAERADEPRDRASLDGLSHRDGVPVLVGEGKAVFLGQRHLWRPVGPGGEGRARQDGLARYVEYQALWYADVVGVPVYVAALMLPVFDLGGMPPEAALHLAALHVWRVDPSETEAERAALRDVVAAWREAGCPESAPTAVRVEEPERPRVLPGTWADAVLLARYERARGDLEAARAEAAAHSEDLDAIKAAIRARVGDQRGLRAGGRTATVDKRGSVRVTSDNPTEESG